MNSTDKSKLLDLISKLNERDCEFLESQLNKWDKNLDVVEDKIKSLESALKASQHALHLANEKITKLESSNIRYETRFQQFKELTNQY